MSTLPAADAMDPPGCGGATSRPPAGARRIDGYRVGRLLGRGRTAAVHLAQDRDGALVALKIIERAQGRPEPDWNRFATECALLAAVQHPHVVRLHRHAARAGIAYVAMDYLPGGTLRERVRGGLPPAQAVHLLQQAAAGLAAAHAAGIVHRDVKPENFLRRADGGLVLTDFGSAARTGDDGACAAAGRLLGTLRYAAPEQLAGVAPSPAADVYSLGIVFHEMLCGAPPFGGRTPVELVSQHLVAPVPRLPQGLECYQSLIDRLLDKRAQHRPRDAQAVLHHIQTLPPAGGARAA